MAERLPMEPEGRGLWSRLDGPSRRIVVGFLTRAAFGLVLIGISSRPAAAVHAYAALNVGLSGCMAILLRHPFSGPRFTLWDDVLWFSAISYGAQILA